MLEIEVKYPVPEFKSVEGRLETWQVPLSEDRHDADAYFNAPHRDFAQTDEAFRVRRIGERNFITYKGPRIDWATKTRTEIEIPLGDGQMAADDCGRMFQALGFRPVAIVKKHRRVFEFTRGGFDLEVCLDEVDQLGRFVEVEIMAEESQLEAARGVLLRCATELGLVESERRSYLELLLANSPK